MAVVMLAAATPVLAEIRLPAAFTDHMVIQRDRPIRVFGSAQTHEEVTVELRDSKGAALRSGKVAADQSGRFAVTLEGLPGGNEPLTLEVRGSNTVTVSDILVGDVWVAGGQSNMEWPLAATGAQLDDARAVALDGTIRVLKAPHVTANRPAESIDARWQVLDAKTLPETTAVGFWFANAIHARTGLPVGILSINWGGTRAEPWADLATLGSDPAYTEMIGRQRMAVDAWHRLGQAERDRAYEARRRIFQNAGTQWWTAVNDGEPGVVGKWADPGTATDGDGWRTVSLPSAWNADPELRSFDGSAWYRRQVTVPEAWAGKDLVLELGAIDDADVAFWNGRAVANTIADWTTPRKYRVPAPLVKAGEATLTVEVLDMHGEGGFRGDAAAMRLSCPGSQEPPVMLAGEWRMRLGRDAKGLPQPPERPSRDSAPGTSPTAPGALFNAMIAPFAGFGVRGAIWYQGESNAGSEEEATAYASLLPLVIRSWRAAFEQPDMPFGVVSLAAFKEHRPDSPTHGTWPVLRDSQLAAERNSPNVGVITTIDEGQAVGGRAPRALGVERELRRPGPRVARAAPEERSARGRRHPCVLRRRARCARDPRREGPGLGDRRGRGRRVPRCAGRDPAAQLDVRAEPRRRDPGRGALRVAGQPRRREPPRRRVEAARAPLPDPRRGRPGAGRPGQVTGLPGRIQRRTAKSALAVPRAATP
jgi:sialate O-acetylesterase